MVKSRALTATENRKIFVISDLHIGDGSTRDNLLKKNKHVALQLLLDEIEKQDGVLVILGDLLELWRYRCEDILDRWHRLLNRIAQMDPIYVPGNHDNLWAKSFETVRRMHPLFDQLHRPFTKDIGGRRFKFMHGHELDPMISDKIQKLAPVMRMLTGVFEYREDMCLITNDRFSDILLEAGERALRFWQKTTFQIDHSAIEHLGICDETWTQLKRPIRTRNMLSRFYQQQQEGLYDVTITGHTHKAGCFRQWYFNSGCWTREILNYITIDADGRVCVCNWTPEGSQVNNTAIM